MINYEIDRKYLRITESSSGGMQNKYFYRGYWYKQNVTGYEGYAEYLVSLLLEHSTIEDYVKYEPCKINGRPGCRSGNFLEAGQSFVSLERLYNIHVGDSLQNRIYVFDDVKKRREFVVDFVRNATGLDIRDYLEMILQLDCITLNTDRHLHNLGVIMDGERYRFAPVFDNGAALLSSFSLFPPDREIEELVEKAVAKPFSGSFTQQCDMMHPMFRIDMDGLLRRLEELNTPCRGTGVLKQQLKVYKNFGK